eukprot:GHVN01068688.1.p1 GENE.GHVN01068688.1~~GHVN01068688.1.p1  ORF type:complete len:716 (-),score=86.59 GHVN01068688.1:1572-3686(-)
MPNQRNSEDKSVKSWWPLYSGTPSPMEITEGDPLVSQPHTHESRSRSQHNSTCRSPSPTSTKSHGACRSCRHGQQKAVARSDSSISSLLVDRGTLGEGGLAGRTLSLLLADPEDDQPLLMTLPSGLYVRRHSLSKKHSLLIDHSTSLTINDEEGQQTMSQLMEGDPEYISPGLLSWTFIVLLCLSVLCNYDHGAIPACLGEIQEELHLSYIRQSLIGNLVYIGFLIGSLVAGVVFQYCNAKTVLVGCVSSLCAILAVFSLVKQLYMIYITRFLTGLCQAFPVVFAPVWVTEYAAEGMTNQWVALSQLASILGTTLGYFVGGVLSHWAPLTDHANRFYVSTWQTPFIIQCVACIPVLIALALIPNRCLNRISISMNPTAQPNERRVDGGGEGLVWSGEMEESEVGEEVEAEKVAMTDACQECCISTFSQWGQFLGRPLYLFLIGGISNLFFVVTGIQFWVTEYMIVHLNYSKMTVVTWTTFTFLTSPVLGVSFGGWLIDKVGGSRGAAQMKKAIRISTLFAFLAACLSIICTLVNSLLFFGTSLWFMLFFGGGLVPTATTLLIHSVPPKLRSHASALTQFAQNLLGYFPAPLISGAVMDAVSHAGYTGSVPLMWGFRFIMYSSIVGVVFCAAANCVEPMDFEEENRFSDVPVQTEGEGKRGSNVTSGGETQLSNRQSRAASLSPMPVPASDYWWPSTASETLLSG